MQLYDGLLLGHQILTLFEMNELYSSLGIITSLPCRYAGRLLWMPLRNSSCVCRLTPEKLVADLSFSLVYAGLTGFQLQSFVVSCKVTSPTWCRVWTICLDGPCPLYHAQLFPDIRRSCPALTLLSWPWQAGGRAQDCYQRKSGHSLRNIAHLSFILYLANLMVYSFDLCLFLSFDVVFLPLLSILFILSFVYQSISLTLFLSTWRTSFACIAAGK